MTDELTKIAKAKYNKVRETLKETCKKDRHAKLLEMGFEYVEEDDDTEKIEENNAIPENKRQKIIEKYFKAQSELYPDIIQKFIEEIESAEPNYPLLRKHFKRGGSHIIKLLQESLILYPCRKSLLNALAYFSLYNSSAFSEMIKSYNIACKAAKDQVLFKELVKSFYINTSAHDYNAFLSLKELYKNDNQKLDLLNRIEKDFEGEVDITESFN